MVYCCRLEGCEAGEPIDPPNFSHTLFPQLRRVLERDIVPRSMDMEGTGVPLGKMVRTGRRGSVHERGWTCAPCDVACLCEALLPCEVWRTACRDVCAHPYA